MLASDDLKLYDKPTEDAEELDLVPKGTTVYSKYNYYIDNKDSGWLYVHFNNRNGWIKGDDGKAWLLENVAENMFDESIFDINEEPVEDELPTIEKKEKPVVKKSSPKEIIVFSVVGGFCLIVCALVTILYLNREKRLKMRRLMKI